MGPRDGNEKNDLEADSKIKENSEIPLSDHSDADLLRFWRSGNQQAASVLMDRYAARLVSLIAARLGHKLRGNVDAEDVVQSAMGSFFHAAHRGKVDISQSVSAWNLLTVFARRKLARAIEKTFAAKRGGDFQRIQLELDQEMQLTVDDQTGDLLTSVLEDIPSELRSVCRLLWAGYNQKEIANELNVNQRTVRRRIEKLRELVSPRVKSASPTSREFSTDSLPAVGYHEFVLGSMIGSGGFGKVYRATLRSDDSIIAVKFLRKHFWQNQDAKVTFLTEIESASQIDSPHIIRYRGWGQSPHGGPYVISEWINGRALSEIHNMSFTRFVGLLDQLCTALMCVHQAGITHGDMTPNNVLVSENDHLVLTDFGFARSSRVETLNPIGGTLGYAAPEQLASAFGEIGPATDVYAVGGIAHWYLTGKSPNAATTTQDSYAKTLACEPISIATEFHSAGEEKLAELIASMLRPSPSDRIAIDTVSSYLRGL